MCAMVTNMSAAAPDAPTGFADTADHGAKAMFVALIDDAALFPPGNAPMAAALPAHVEHRRGPHGLIVGRFLCPASRLDELQAALADDQQIDLGLILDTGIAWLPEALARTGSDDRLHLTAVEVPIRADADQAVAAHEAAHALARLPADVHGFVELPRVHGWRDALGLLAARGHGVKLRTGGLVAEAFPTDLELAEFIHAGVGEGARFKCTAGLHHAVRHRDEGTGFEHHGFLNVIAATAAAVGGASIGELVGIVGERDPGDVVELLGEVGTATNSRRHFTGFGTCGVDEPLADLTGLGLIEKREDPLELG